MDGPIQLSLPLPRSLDTRIYLQLTIRAKSITLFVTTASSEEAGAPTPLGSFVYAIPDRYNPSQPLSTPLNTVEPTIEFTTRLAKLVAKKSQLPTYVANSVSFMGAGLGGSVEEELETFKQVAGLVLSRLPTASPSVPTSAGP
ncbi:hypothetical protein B0T18DRAFT_319383 [Schizothecium vesticola]|uniref:Uncharacterized protein n=1 Tax=Schizothecium vesticola TaxID=314040 RepID=A0AA40F6G5_9PEZI|nr:hypothetical protein B0T18DRAFT_319383 [Schizothecium vesticola]